MKTIHFISTTCDVNQVQYNVQNSLECNIIKSVIFYEIVIYLTSSCVNWAFFGMSGPD
jgi:hypothetical protein